MKNINREYNHKTQSYYTEEEYLTLTGRTNSEDNISKENNFNFSWSNRSNSENTDRIYENCIYKYEDGRSYDIQVTKKNGFILEIRTPSYIGVNIKYFRNLNFEKLINILSSKKIDLKFFFYKINVILLFIPYFLIIMPFLLMIATKEDLNGKKRFSIFRNKINESKNLDYFLLQDSLNFVWILNSIFITGIISYFLFS